MVVGILEVVLYLHDNDSLTGKRAVVRSTKRRVQAKFNLSLSACDEHAPSKRITLGAPPIGAHRDHVDRCLREVSTFIDQLGLAESGDQAYHFETY